MLGGKPPNQKKAATIALTGLFQNWGSVSQDNNLLIKHMSGPCLLRSATLQWQLTVVMSHLPKTFLVKTAFWQASRHHRINLVQLLQTSYYSLIIWTIYITGNVQIWIYGPSWYRTFCFNRNVLSKLRTTLLLGWPHCLNDQAFNCLILHFKRCVFTKNLR